MKHWACPRGVRRVSCVCGVAMREGGVILIADKCHNETAMIKDVKYVTYYAKKVPDDARTTVSNAGRQFKVSKSISLIILFGRHTALTKLFKERSNSICMRNKQCAERQSKEPCHFLPAIRSLERKARYLFYFCCFVRFFVNDFSPTRGPIHAKFCMRAYSGSECVFSPFGGWRPPAGGKRGK